MIGRPISRQYSPAALVGKIAFEGDKWSVVILSGNTPNGTMFLRAGLPINSSSQYGGLLIYVLCLFHL